MKKRYLHNWKNSFNVKDKISREDFWVFLVVNYVILIFLLIAINGLAELCDSDSNIFDYINIIISVFFIVPIISAGIRRLNDINKPKYYLLIPFYNIFLLAQKGMISNKTTRNTFPHKFLVRIILGTILIGVINTITSLLFLDLIINNASSNAVVGVILFALCSIPFSLFLTFLQILFTSEENTKRKINSILRYSFVITLSLLLLITYEASK